jgi:hypothetical protein
MTHDIIIDKQEQEENPKKNLAFKIIHHIDDYDHHHYHYHYNHKGMEGDIALITKHFQSFLRKKGRKDSQTIRKMETRKIQVRNS